MKERGTYLVAALLDARYEVRTRAGEWFRIVRAAMVHNRAMRLELSDGSTSVYPTDVPLFSRRSPEQQESERGSRPLPGDQPE